MFFAAVFSDEVLPKATAIGLASGTGFSAPARFPLLEPVPVFRADRSVEIQRRISDGHFITLRELTTDASMSDNQRREVGKPDFVFGDSAADPSIMLFRESRWLREINGVLCSLPAMTRGFSVVELRPLSVPRSISWDLTPTQDGVTCGTFTGPPTGYGIDGSHHGVVALHPGLLSSELPVGEIPTAAETFRSRFFQAGGMFPSRDFRAPGWIHSSSGTNQWWYRITEYVLSGIPDFQGIELRRAIRATQYGLKINASQLFSILELYCPDSGTFYTPNGELGLALHEMYEVSGLPMGEFPYEEYVPGQGEIDELAIQQPQMLETFWELLCHFHICLDTLGSVDHKGGKKRAAGISHKNWADYLFPHNEDKRRDISPLTECDTAAINARMSAGGGSGVLEHDDGGFPAGTAFQSYHRQAEIPISSKALLAGYLMMWLKRYVVPTHSFEAIPVEVVYPAVRLAYGRSYALVSAMTACLQSGLRKLSAHFCRVEVVTVEGEEVTKTPSPRVSLPYAYLMAWFVLHCECLMGAPAACPEGEFVPFLQRLETCSWRLRDMVEMRRALDFFGSYNFFRSFPYFPGGGYGESLRDTSTSGRRTVLNLGSFRWLVNIRPGYHFFRSGPSCFLEPYLPNRFSRQFGYDQLYVGNINPHLRFEGGLVDGARGWFWTQAGCTGARFELPQRGRVLRQTFTYCKWYRSVSVSPEGFDIYRSCLPERERRSRGTSRTSRRRGHRQAESSGAAQPEEREAAMAEGTGAGATEEIWEAGPHGDVGGDPLLGSHPFYSPSRPGYGLGVHQEQAGGDVVERLQRSLFTPTPPSPLKRQREADASSSGERAVKRVHSGEAFPEVGPAAPTFGAPVVAVEAHVLAQTDAPITSGGACLWTPFFACQNTAKLSPSYRVAGAASAAVQVSSGDEDEDASYHEATLSPRGGEDEGEAPTLREELRQAEGFLLEEELPAPGTASAQEGVSTHVEAAPGVGEALVLTEETPNRGELSARTEVTPGEGEASTPMVVAASAAVQASPTEDAILSPAARIKRKLVEAAIRSFESLLGESVQMVLDGSGSFSELEPSLQMYVNNLATLTGTHAALPFQRRLTSAEKVINEFLALRSTNLLEMASAHEQDARERQQRSMDELKAREDELAKAVEQIVAEGKAAEEDLRSAKSFLADTDKSIAETRRTIEELQALLVDQAAIRAQALKRLEELESKQQLTLADFEEKSKALEEIRSNLASSALLTDEDLRRQIMADLEKDHRRKLQEAESRLRRF